MNERARQLGLTRTRYGEPPRAPTRPAPHERIRSRAPEPRRHARPFFRRTVAHRTATIPVAGGRGRARAALRERPARHRPRGGRREDGHDRRDAGYTLVGRSRRAGLGVSALRSMIGSPSAQARGRDAGAAARLGLLAVRPRHAGARRRDPGARAVTTAGPACRCPTGRRPRSPRRSGSAGRHRDARGADRAAGPGERGRRGRLHHPAPGPARRRAAATWWRPGRPRARLWDRVRSGLGELIP